MIPSTSTNSAPLAERGNYDACCEALTLENQRIPVLRSKAKKLPERLVDRAKPNAASKTAPKDCRRKCATAASKLVASSTRSLLTPRCFICHWQKMLLTLRQTLTRCALTCGINRHVLLKSSSRQSCFGKICIRFGAVF